MRYQIEGDLLIRPDHNGEEVGTISRTVPMNRVRWNGKRLVDIARIRGFWVDKKKVLHVFDVGDCTYIDMTYQQRKNLIIKDGVPRLKTSEELATEKQKSKSMLTTAKVKKRIKSEYESDLHYRIVRDKCFWILVNYALTGNLKFRPFLQDNLDKVKSILGIEGGD
jgi:hypothetical protein